MCRCHTTLSKLIKRLDSRGWETSAGFVKNLILWSIFKRAFLGGLFLIACLWFGLLGGFLRGIGCRDFGFWFTQNLDLPYLKSGLEPWSLCSPPPLNDVIPWNKWQLIHSQEYLWVNSCGWPQWDEEFGGILGVCSRFSCRGMDTAATVLCKSSPLTTPPLSPLLNGDFWSLWRALEPVISLVVAGCVSIFHVTT